MTRWRHSSRRPRATAYARARFPLRRLLEPRLPWVGLGGHLLLAGGPEGRGLLEALVLKQVASAVEDPLAGRQFRFFGDTRHESLASLYCEHAHIISAARVFDK